MSSFSGVLSEVCARMTVLKVVCHVVLAREVLWEYQGGELRVFPFKLSKSKTWKY